MEYEYRLLSEEKAAEINAKGLKDNLGRKKDINRGDSVTTKDESVIFQQIWIAKNYNIENEQDVYFLLYKNNYYYIEATDHIDGEPIENGRHRYFTYDISSIMRMIEDQNQKDSWEELLKVLKEVLYVWSEHCLKQRPGNQTSVKVLFRGEEI